MIQWLKNYLERRELKRMFGRYVSPELVEQMLNEPSETPVPDEVLIEYVIVLLREADVAKLSEIIGGVVEIGIDHNATIGSIISTMITLQFGCPYEDYEQRRSRVELVDDLMEQMGDKIKIVHGMCIRGYCGLWGSKSKMSFGALVPGFDRALEALCATKYGEAKELFEEEHDEN